MIAYTTTVECSRPYGPMLHVSPACATRGRVENALRVYSAKHPDKQICSVCINMPVREVSLHAHR